MTGETTPLQQLQTLLHDLFQFEHSDLGFGIYRLLRLKRDEVEAFLMEQLPARVDEAFDALGGEEREALNREIGELAGRIRENVADDAILPNGEVAEAYAGTNLAKQYAAKQRTLRVVRALAGEVIAFLAQIEEVQRRLFEKRKFVLRADYLAPIKEVPRELWGGVLENTDQREAWERLFSVDEAEELDEAFLEAHPTLVVDTRHFPAAFRDRLLASFEDLDDAVGGVLVRSENYQALRLLERRYAGAVKCVYIDPPYNTGSDDFIYKDRYRHSTWLAMDHDFLVCWAIRAQVWVPNPLPRTGAANARYSNRDDDPRGPWKSSDMSARNYYGKGQYAVTSPSGKVFRNPSNSYWRVSKEKFHALNEDNRIWWGEDGGDRRFILMEMGEYFDRIVMQRIARIIYTPEWKNGEPARRPTDEEIERTPRLVKVLELESYDDALHNLSTEENLARQQPRADAHRATVGEERYRLRYPARLPLESSASMLRLNELEHPFDYTLETLTGDGPETRSVDLVETVNLLLGLHVERMERWRNDADSREYRAVRGRDHDGRSVLVLWRDTAELDPKLERGFLEPMLKERGPFDTVWINGDSAVPGTKSLDGQLKRLLEEG